MADVIGLQPRQFSVTLADGQTKTSEIDLKEHVPVGLFVPSGFDGTAITFEAATDTGGTFVPVKGTDGNAVTLTVAASTFCRIDPTTLLGVRFLKLVSGTTQSPAVVLVLTCVPNG